MTTNRIPIIPNVTQQQQQQLLMNPQLLQQYMMQQTSRPQTFPNQSSVQPAPAIRPLTQSISTSRPVENSAFIQSLHSRLLKVLSSQPDPLLQQKIKELTKSKNFTASMIPLSSQDQMAVNEAV
jgi:hypothetical protein